jgi:hypothetical protein
VSSYFANASCHCDSVIGGSVPMIGCHSVIDSPECVNRVMPPTTTITNTKAQQPKSHTATARSADLGFAIDVAPDEGDVWVNSILLQFRHLDTNGF